MGLILNFRDQYRIAKEEIFDDFGEDVSTNSWVDCKYLLKSSIALNSPKREILSDHLISLFES